MPLVDARDMLGHAGRHGYAVCAFDLVSLDFLAGVMAAASNLRAPVILGLSEPHREYVADEQLLPAVEAAARAAEIPVAVQFGRATSVDAAARAIRLGCNGVALDAEPAADIAAARDIAAMAHACGIPVEGRWTAAATQTAAADSPGVREYVEATGVDSLTVVADPDSPPRLMSELARLGGALSLPLGVDTGRRLDDAEYRQLIQHGVTKIHHYAGLSAAAADRLRRNLRSTPRNGYLRLTRGVREALSAEAERCLRLAGAAGRAADALRHCRPWTLVEHCILYNVGGDAEAGQRVPAMMARGRRVLGAIPGVREVFTGRAARPDARYRYCWLVRFAHPAVIASYRDHPDHAAFADDEFRPLAADRLSLDFGEVG